MSYDRAREQHLRDVRQQVDNCRPNTVSAGPSAYLRERHIQVRCQEDWNLIEPHFMAMAEKYQILSYDSESLLAPEEQDRWAALEGVLIGLYDGTTLDFDVQALR